MELDEWQDPLLITDVSSQQQEEQQLSLINSHKYCKRLVCTDTGVKFYMGL